MKLLIQIGPLAVKAAGQAQGAPLVDKGVIIIDGDVYRGPAIRAPFTRHRPTTALFIGWRSQ